MSARARVTCPCGRPLLYVVGPSSGNCQVELDCSRCQYLVWRTYKAAGDALAKRSVMVVHTVELPAGRVVKSIVLTLDGGDAARGYFMRQRPVGDLARALESCPS